MLATILAGTVSAAPALVAERTYEVMRVDGLVLAWRPFEAQWQELKLHDKILGATLIQAPKSASLVLQRDDQRFKNEVLTLQLSAGMMIRVLEPLNREVTISNFNIQTTKSGMPMGSGLKKGGKGEKGISSAWERFKSIGGKLNDFPADVSTIFKPDEGKQEITIDLALGAIDLTVPSDGSAYIVDHFPAALPLVWEMDEKFRTRKHDVFEAYLRGAKEDDPKFYGRTTDRSMIVKVPSAGVYYLKVVLPANGMESQEVMVTVEAL